MGGTPMRDLEIPLNWRKSTAPSRGALWAGLRKSRRFNAGIMSRSRKQAVYGILQVPPMCDAVLRGRDGVSAT